MKWVEEIITALENLNGTGHLSEIYKEIEKSNIENLPREYKASIRDCLEKNSSDSEKYNKKRNLFFMVEGKGKGKWGLRNYYNNNSLVDLTTDDINFSEGKKSLKLHIKRERNQELITIAKNKFKEKHGCLYCEICGFNFEKFYGDLGKDFIEAHHLKPVSEMKENDSTKIEDLIMVCSNCHSMIHRKKPWLNLKEIKSILKK